MQTQEIMLARNTFWKVGFTFKFKIMNLILIDLFADDSDLADELLGSVSN